MSEPRVSNAPRQKLCSCTAILWCLKSSITNGGVGWRWGSPVFENISMVPLDDDERIRIQELETNVKEKEWFPLLSSKITWTTKFRLSQSRNISTFQFVLDLILSLTVEKLIWSLGVKRSTSLNQRQVKRLEMGMCSRIITHPSGTSACQTLWQKSCQI